MLDLLSVEGIITQWNGLYFLFDLSSQELIKNPYFSSLQGNAELAENCSVACMMFAGLNSLSQVSEPIYSFQAFFW